MHSITLEHILLIYFYKSMVLNWSVIQGPPSTFITLLCQSPLVVQETPVETHCTKSHYSQALRIPFHIHIQVGT